MQHDQVPSSNDHSAFVNAIKPSELHVQNVIGGECYATDDWRVGYSTVLGSCVSLCLYDTQSHMGGMNHFLLPHEPQAGAISSQDYWSFRYGVQAMEELFNALMRLSGRHRQSLRAKLVGGAKMAGGLADIGERNIRFAEQFLAREGVEITSRRLGGHSARRLLFHPASGRAFVRDIEGGRGLHIVANEAAMMARPIPEPADDIELF